MVLRKEEEEADDELLCVSLRTFVRWCSGSKVVWISVWFIRDGFANVAAILTAVEEEILVVGTVEGREEEEEEEKFNHEINDVVVDAAVGEIVLDKVRLPRPLDDDGDDDELTMLVFFRI